MFSNDDGTHMPMSYSVTATMASSLPLVSAAGAGKPGRPGVLIYAPHLLSTGEHWVREHAVRLRRYRPVLAGRRRVEGVRIDSFTRFTMDREAAARLRELRFLLMGRHRGLSRFIEQHDIKLIHAHFGCGGVEIMPTAVRLGLPLVVTFHGWDVKLGGEAKGRMSLYERLYRRRLPRLLEYAKAVICVSQHWHERVLQLGCAPGKLHTNYLGVDSAFFDGVRGRFDPMSLLFVGRLIRRKGVHTLLESLRILREKNIDAHLTIAGDGPEASQLRKTAEQLRLPVRFLGKRQPAEIRELLRSAAILCAPSTTAGGEVPEALGLVLLEAQAMGVPVVSTRNGGIPETMEDGRTGLLVDQDSPPALAEALARLLTDEAENRAFGERARAFVSRRFNVDSCYESLERIYDQTAGAGR